MADILGGGSIGGPLSFGNEPPAVAQLGRIGGKLLNANLLRDGVDLAFETDLLYLDVTNSRIGIKTSSPTIALDVNNTIKTKNLLTNNSIPVDDLIINVNNSITSLVNPIEVFTADPAIFHDRMLTDSLIFDDNKITTFTNENIILDPNGTGNVLFFSGVEQTGNLSVFGNIELTGNLRVDGNIILGDNVVDTVEITADLTQDIIPDTNDSFDIGTPSLRWDSIRLNNTQINQSISVPNFTLSSDPTTIAAVEGGITFVFPAGNTSVTADSLIINDLLKFDDNVISTTVTNSSIDIRPNGTGEINLEGTSNISGNIDLVTNIAVLNNLNIPNNVSLGTNDSNTFRINSLISGALIPTSDSIYNLGSTDLNWNNLYVTTVSIDGSYSVGNFTITSDPSAITVTTGDITFNLVGDNPTVNMTSLIADNNLKFEGNQISTTETNENIFFNPNGTGQINLIANTNVTGDLNVTNNLSPVFGGNLTVENNTVFGNFLADDLITIVPLINSSLIPQTGSNIDLGVNTTNIWRNIYVDSINSSTSATVKGASNITINGNPSTIDTTSFILNVNLSGTDTAVYFPEINVSDTIQLRDNIIESISADTDIRFNPNSSGEINLDADVDIAGNLSVSIDTELNDLSVDGDIILGNVSTDTTTINAGIINDLIPDTDLTYNIGSLSKRWRQGYVANVEIENSSTAANFIIDNTPAKISTSSGNIDFVFPEGNSTVTAGSIIVSDAFRFEGNLIEGLGTNENLRFNPNASGTINLEAETNVTGDFSISGNSVLSGDLSTANNLIIGDQITDTVAIAPDLTQDIIPGTDRVYDLGRDAGDSSPRYWQDAYILDNTNITSVYPMSITVSEQTLIDGTTNTISTIQSNENLQLSPATGKTNIDGDISIGTAQVPLSTLTTIDNPDSDGSPIGDGFGQRVDASASYFIVSARFEDTAPGGGQAHVYSAITGTLIQTLTNPNAFGTGANDNYAWDVAISESYAVVGAPGEDDPSSSGRVYVYSTADWSLLHTLNNPNTYGTPSFEGFGESVEVSESYVIVGARDEDDVGGFGVGRAYIYDAATGTLLHTLNNPTGTANDQFGVSVAITDTHAVVGAQGYSSSQGRVYVYNPATGSLRYTIENPLGGGYYRFGASVDVSDSWIIVGSPDDGTASGSVHIFETGGGGQIFYITNPNAYGTSTSDYFGEAVGITESYAIVGAAFEDAAGETDTGKAYIFSTVDASLLQTVNNPNPDGVSTAFNQDLFGYDVAINELSAAIGTFAEDEGASNQGKAYFLLPAGGDTSQGIITNLTNNALILAATGRGYYNFAGTNAMLLPAGDDAARPSSPEVGDTRWSTERDYLEVYDGTVYLSAAGDTGTLSAEDIEDNSFVYTIILG